ncbi:hypothetical protein Mapa_011155 [Marchantia paleacea]|nr:hypothetical protein Mapa_011155 [Marchantia paleacea]
MKLELGSGGWTSARRLADTMSNVMARRLGGVTPRRASDSEDSAEPTEPSSPRAKSQSSPYLSVVLLLAVVLLIIGYNSGRSSSYKSHGAGALHHDRRIDLVAGGDVSARHISATDNSNIQMKDDDDLLSDFLALKDGNRRQKPECRSRVCAAIPILQEMYGVVMHRTLHMGPGTCGVVSKLREEEGNEVWGIQPYEMRKPVHKLCKNLIKRGIVRVGDPSRIPYRARSFSFVLVTGTLEQMTSKELNQTLLDLARVSSNRLVLIVGNGGRPNSAGKMQKPLKPRSRSWWQRRLQGVGLEEDEDLALKFDTLQAATTFRTSCNIFHLRVPHGH